MALSQHSKGLLVLLLLDQNIQRTAKLWPGKNYSSGSTRTYRQKQQHIMKAAMLNSGGAECNISYADLNI